MSNQVTCVTNNHGIISEIKTVKQVTTFENCVQECKNYDGDDKCVGVVYKTKKKL